MMQKFLMTHDVATFECDRSNTMKFSAVLDLFQSAAGLHADTLGCGWNYCLQTGHAWLAVAYHIQILQYPKMNEKITIRTWPSQKTRIKATRDFEILDANGDIIIRASSQWVLINMDNKRLLNLLDVLPNLEKLEERAVDSDFNIEFDSSYIDLQKGFHVRFDDIDINQHTNNTLYPLWATESVPADFRVKNIVGEIVINFKSETFYGDAIEVLTKMDADNNFSSHSIKCQDKECARISIVWKKNDTNVVLTRQRTETV
ncbi:MAG: hypothetical protein LBU68_02375 [Rickettsiales bacterium]|jgi:acyl-ACP thioesterase|nr:hypothetical protein [Rickettsiales bacterium]